MSDATGRGRFVWYDLITASAAQAVDFYTKLIGWETQKWGDGAVPYTMWTNNSAPLGGVGELSEEDRSVGVSPHWRAYVAVEDVDATLAHAEELGGSVVQPATAISGAGSYGVLADPQGTTIGVYASAEQPSTAPWHPETGAFSWHELVAGEYRAAFTFYRALFGWEQLEAMDMGEAGVYQLYGQDQQAYGGMFTRTADMPGPPQWLYYIMVKDVETSVALVTELGGQVVVGPLEVPGGDQIAQCIDPQGAMFALHAKV